jgi:hypothetical protein
MKVTLVSFYCYFMNKVVFKIIFDQNLKMIDHKFNDDFRSHVIFRVTQEKNKSKF